MRIGSPVNAWHEEPGDSFSSCLQMNWPRKVESPVEPLLLCSILCMAVTWEQPFLVPRWVSFAVCSHGALTGDIGGKHF
ncbi:hypothetical protein LEMLEM_LOCUS1544 [Lemmus lemmus]